MGFIRKTVLDFDRIFKSFLLKGISHYLWENVRKEKKRVGNIWWMGELQLVFNYNKYENAIGEVLLIGEIIKLNYSSVPSLKDFCSKWRRFDSKQFTFLYCLLPFLIFHDKSVTCMCWSQGWAIWRLKISYNSFFRT